jgi:hypothetical protein
VKYGSSGYDADLQAQMDAIFQKATGGRRAPRQDEYDQWIGPRGYLSKDDINGSGQTLKAWTPGSQIDPYWQWRMTGHAQGDYYGDNPGYLPEDDQNAYRQTDTPQFSPPARTSETTGASSLWANVMTPQITAPQVTTQNYAANYTAPKITTPSYQYTPTPINTGTPPASELTDAARERILGLLRTPQTVDPQALRDSPEMQGVYLMAQRAEERDRAALAERASAGGWSGSGGFEGGLNALRQQRGETEMQMMGTLAATYMERQREDLQRGIESALNQGQFEAAQSLQRDLAALNAQIQQEQIGAQVGMSNADLALRAQLGQGDLDLRGALGFSDLDLRRLLGQGDLDLRAQLGQGDLALRSQLGQGDLALRGDQLGFDYAQLQYQANRDAALAMLRRS